MKLYACALAIVLAAVACTADAPGKVKLEAIDFSESIYLAKSSIHVTVSPDGDLRVTRNRSGKEQTASAKLREDQIAKLVAVFTEWAKLKKSYPGVVDGPETTISYGGHTVTSGGGNDTPKSFLDARNLLMELANSALQESQAKK